MTMSVESYICAVHIGITPAQHSLCVRFVSFKIEFGGADLLQLYNRDQLRRRLLTLGSPVTGAGSSVMARMNRQGALQTTPGWAFSPWEPGTSASTTTTTSMTTNAPGTPSSDIAFVIEVYNRKPGESVIVGVRVGLPVPTGEYATRWPKFFKVFYNSLML